MPLTPEQIADGWIEHDGSGCPVPLDSRLTPLFRGHFDNRPGMVAVNKRVHREGRVGYAKYLRWKFAPFSPASDIIAYLPENRHD